MLFFHFPSDFTNATKSAINIPIFSSKYFKIWESVISFSMNTHRNMLVTIINDEDQKTRGDPFCAKICVGTTGTVVRQILELCKGKCSLIGTKYKSFAPLLRGKLHCHAINIHVSLNSLSVFERISLCQVTTLSMYTNVFVTTVKLE